MIGTLWCRMSAMANGDRSYFDPLVSRASRTFLRRAALVVEGIMSGIHRQPVQMDSASSSNHPRYSPGDELRRIAGRRSQIRPLLLHQREPGTRPIFGRRSSSTPARRWITGSNGVTKFEYASILTARSLFEFEEADAAASWNFRSRRLVHSPQGQARHVFEISALSKRTAHPAKPTREKSSRDRRQNERRGMVILVSVCSRIRRSFEGSPAFSASTATTSSSSRHGQARSSCRSTAIFFSRNLEQADLKVTADPQTIRQAYRAVSMSSSIICARMPRPASIDYHPSQPDAPGIAAS